MVAIALSRFGRAKLEVHDLALAITVNPDPPGNQMPFVSAGLDQTITLPAIAILDGTVSDDGLPNPPGGLTITWSTASGPGEVIFLNASIVDTTVNFSVAGIYVLRLTANDGELTAYDDVILTVEPVPSTNTIVFAPWHSAV